MRKKFTTAQLSVTHGFGDRLAQERRAKAYHERRDISQKDVATAVGTTRPSMSRWEAGGAPPSDAMIARLAAYFGVTPAWLRYGQEPREAPVPVHASEPTIGELAPNSKKVKAATKGAAAGGKK